MMPFPSRRLPGGNAERQRRYLLAVPLLVLMLPLALGQGWIGEAVINLLPFRRPPDGIRYFLQPSIEQTRVFNLLPYAVALLTPWPEWVIAALTVAVWMATAAVSYFVARRLLGSDTRTAIIAFFVAGTTAYDLTALQAAYLPLSIATLLHWAGFAAMAAYCDRRTRAWLLTSSMLQFLSLFTYGGAVGAIVLGPLIAYAFVARRDGRREALRTAVAVGAAWWPWVMLYLGVLAWSTLLPNSYLATAGGLRFSPSWKQAALIGSLFAENFDPWAWTHAAALFGEPTRVIKTRVVAALAVTAAGMMLALVAASSSGDRRDARKPVGVAMVGVLLLVILVSNAAASLTQLAEFGLRTHLVSRLYASLLIAAACGALLQAQSRAAILAGAAATALYLAAGAWTLVDRAVYLVSIWPPQRTELRSFDEAVRRIDPAAFVVLYVPSGIGYIANVVPWHAFPWHALIRSNDEFVRTLVHWSPDRGSVCTVSGASLVCKGDLQRTRQLPLDATVLLRYDPADCRIKIVDQGWVGGVGAAAPAGYAPRAWMLETPAEPSPLFRKLLYGPQGLGANLGCR